MLRCGIRKQRSWVTAASVHCSAPGEWKAGMMSVVQVGGHATWNGSTATSDTSLEHRPTSVPIAVSR